MTYTVRCKSLGKMGIVLQADAWEDFTIDSTDTLSGLAQRLAREGFSGGDKWIMPAAIMWIKRQER